MTTVLYRPVNKIELDLIRDSGWKRFPPRLPEQPIFYPVMNLEYARQITIDWNVRAYGNGYVTKFEVKSVYLEKFEIQNVGGAIYDELWIPSEDLDEFNNNIVGLIDVVESYESEGQNSVGT